MYLKKVNKSLYKYESIRKGNRIVTLYKGKTTFWERVYYKLKTLTKRFIKD
jgi:hypothetical protein